MDLFRLLGTIAIENGTANSAIDDTTSKAATAESKMSSSFKKIGAAIATYFSVSKIVDFGKACVSAYQLQEKSELQLATIMRQRMSATDSAITSIKELTSAEQRLGVVGDEVQMMGAQQLATFLNSTKALQTLIPAMNNLAVQQNGYNVTSEAMVSIGNMMGKVMQGQTEALTRVGITFNEAQGKVLKYGTEEEKAAVLAQVITDNVGNMNEVLAQTDSGQIQQAKNNFGDLKEMIGGRVLPVVTSFYDKLNSASLFVMNNFGSIISVVKTATTVFVALGAAMMLQKGINGIQAAQRALILFTLENGKAATAQELLNGTFTVGQIAVNVLTGNISLSAVAHQALANVQAKLNAVMAANPYAVVAAALATLGVVIYKTVKANDEIIASLAGEAESAEEAAAKVEELKAKIEELESTDPAYWSDAMQSELDNYRLALIEAENQLAEFEAAQQAAADAAAEPAARLQAATEEYAENLTTLLDTFQQTYTAMSEKVGSWFEPFETAKVSVTTSIGDMMAAMQSQIDFNTTYSANLQKLKDYGLGTLSSAFQSYGAEGSAYAQTIVAAVEEAGGATSEGGQQIIEDFQKIQSEVESSQGELSGTLTTLSGDFDAAIQDMVQSLGEGIEGLDKGAEAYEAATSTLSEYLAGVQDQVPGILDAMTALGQQITAALQAGIGTVSLPGFTGGGFSGFTVGRYATGLDYVPYDEFPAYLHKGEMVLPAEEANFIRNGFPVAQNIEVVTVLQQILSALQDASRQETVLKINNRELGRAVREVAYA